MKAMKLVMMAVITVLMGTTLTSCLDSGDTRTTHVAMVNILQFEGIFESMKKDNGVTLKPINPSYLQFTLNEKKIMPDRALIYFYTVDDVPIEEGVKSYDIELSAVKYFDVKYPSYELIEAKSPFTDISKLYEAGNYVDFSAEFFVDKLDFNNYKMIIEKAEEETIYVNLISVEEIEKLTSDKKAIFNFSMRKPNKLAIERQFENFKIPENGKVKLQITAKGIQEEGSSNYQDKKAEIIEITIE